VELSVSAAAAIDQTSALAEAVDAVAREQDAQQALPGAAAGVNLAADATANLVRGGFVERVLGEVDTGVAAPPAEPPGVRADKGVETAVLQSFARPHASVSEPLRGADTAAETAADNALPATQNAHSEFAVPASLLVPATLIGLQVEHAAGWPMTARGFEPDATPLHEARASERTPAHDEQEPEGEPEHEDEAPSEEPCAHEKADAPVVEQQDRAWCEELNRVVRIALAARTPPHALQLAAEQWRRSRCVVLACPQGVDAAGPAWAFVLWPRKQTTPRAEGAPPPIELMGARVEALLHWSAPPTTPQWHATRVIKQHHPRTGRQLIPLEAAAHVACEVQLGPVLARPLRHCNVCLRINAVRRFWNALGAQWSLHVVVCSQPLIDDGATVEGVPC
jgi:hypothetical protein